MSRRKGGLPNLFFLDEILYRRITVNKTKDIVKVYSMLDREFQFLSYTYTINNFERAYNLREVAAFLNRSPHTLRIYVYGGKVVGTHAVAWPMTERGNHTGFYWSPRGIEKAWQIFVDIQRSVTEDPLGYGQTKRLPTLAELRANIRNEVVLYYKDPETGEFRPTWKP